MPFSISHSNLIIHYTSWPTSIVNLTIDFYGVLHCSFLHILQCGLVQLILTYLHEHWHIEYYYSKTIMLLASALRQLCYLQFRCKHCILDCTGNHFSESIRKRKVVFRQKWRSCDIPTDSLVGCTLQNSVSTLNRHGIELRF